MRKILVLITLAITITSCGIIVNLTDSKNSEGQFVESEISVQANDYFWDQFHQGNYENIPEIISKLNIALADNPYDLVTTAHLGFAHIWALAERQRLDEPQANITEHLILARRYFEEAVKMSPHDPRLIGFLADMSLAEGGLLQDQRIVVEGYFKGLESIRMWPQFNKFTIGYAFSTLDTADNNFNKAIKWQYETLDDCACEKVDLDSDYLSVVDKIKNSTDRKISRACWNSWIAPHNWEGFCLNFGDMLTKKGNIKEAAKIYNLARLSDDFDNWPFKNVLEKRIVDIRENFIHFNQTLDERNLKSQSVMLFSSENACGCCHTMGPQDQIKYQNFERLGKDYYFLQKKTF
ncbi:hypothetical protein N9B82_06810 [Saprospiraceae bacterium]|nr:hypothetical protein [Saprospiraceae bacterium]